MTRNKKPGPPNEFPWERIPRETDTAWESFVTYRDLGYAKRTIKLTAETLGKSEATCGVWCRTNQWVERCHAYDSFLDKKKREADLEEILKMRKRQINMALKLQGAGDLALNKIVAAERLLDKDGNPLPATLKAGEVATLVDLGVKLERLNRGEPEVIVAQQVTTASAPPSSEDVVYDWTRLTVEEQRTMQKLARKAKKKIAGE